MLEAGENQLEFFTSEPVHGQLLAERLANGPLPRAEALRVAIEVGRALHAAHSRGVVHGNLTPSAIVLTPAGARVLKPTPVRDVTPYMAPERIHGLALDWRGDVFAFGAILHDMVAGRPETRPSSRTSPLLAEANAAAVEDRDAVLEQGIDRVARACMEKDPGRRRQRIQNAVLELRLMAAGEAARNSTPRRAPTGAPRRPTLTRLRLLAWGAILLTLMGFAVAIASWANRRAAPGSVLRFAVPPPEHASYPGPPAISPNGRFLVFPALGPDGKRMLWLRPLDGLHATALPGTEGGFAPFWSPDSATIAFFADKALKKVPLTGGAPKAVCGAEGMAGGGSWGAGGVIVFAPAVAGPLFQVPAGGGTPRPATTLEASNQERAHLWPQFLPDGKNFLFFAQAGSVEATGVYAGALETPERKFLLPSESNAVYAPDSAAGDRGALVFLRYRNLTAQVFDPAKLELGRESVVLAEDFGAVESMALAPVSVSANGIMAYQSVSRSTRQLVWFDRGGRQTGSAADPGDWGPPRISPDGTRVVAGRADSATKTADLWILERDGGMSRLTSTPHNEGSPVWSPDGSRIAYFSDQNGSFDVYQQSAVAGARAELLLKSTEQKYPNDWSPDGRLLLFSATGPGTQLDLFWMSLADRRPDSYLKTIYAEGYGAFSPDGKWVAFQSDESGRDEVYVEPFAGLAGSRLRQQLSTGGGGMPRWRADGKELFYATPDGRIVAVPVNPGGGAVNAGTPADLFQTRPSPKTWNLYDAAPDGQRFLVNVPLESSNTAPITVVTNCFNKLGR